MTREYRRRLGGFLRVRKLLLVGLGIALGLAAAVAALHRRPPPAAPDHSSAPAPDCQAGPTTPGIDVSYYQETIDWHRVHRAGLRFAFIRVADGAELRDPMFSLNWAEARSAGIARGAYQFFRPDQSAEAQADLLIAVLRAQGTGELPPALDVEVDAGLGAPAVAAAARRWIDRVRAQLGVEPIIYTGSDLWRTGAAGPLATQPLWLAHYTPRCPAVPLGWPRWTFWQHTDRGAVPGIEGPVDLDVFAGSLDELRALR
ncbi:MAG TPA: GH25 family lysozyme [Kofleriaceae bacterium]|nr:GH25 family lysozyme [Kofleriaceae bacterium]